MNATAFLKGDLDEEIFMELPQGFVSNKKLVCKLKKSLYGLKQSPRCWNTKFVKFLKSFSFICIDGDRCVFIGIVNGIIVYLAIYVDDGILISKCIFAIETVLRKLRGEFGITEDEAKEFLGMEIERDREARSIKISQTAYLEKILCRFNMSDAKPSSVPAEPGLVLQREERNVIIKFPYIEAVGSLLFLAIVSDRILNMQ